MCIIYILLFHPYMIFMLCDYRFETLENKVDENEYEVEVGRQAGGIGRI